VVRSAVPAAGLGPAGAGHERRLQGVDVVRQVHGVRAVPRALQRHLRHRGVSGTKKSYKKAKFENQNKQQISKPRFSLYRLKG
jgi:hypothetical protein